MTATALPGTQHLVPVYARRDVCFVSGEGCELVDDTGRRFLDFTAGIGVNALGYGHPVIRAAIEDAAVTGLLHVSNLYRNRSAEELAELLTARSFGSHVFFANSGAEAVEGALKFARRAAVGESKREIVAVRGGFHGRTYGALSVTDRPDYRRPFEPLVPGMRFIDREDPERARAAIEVERTAAVIVEPIQGEGGVRPISSEFLGVLRDCCDAAGAALIFDEIQCGLGRTGERYAFEPSGVEPDIVVLAKPLGGGLPMGAVVVNERIASMLSPGDHGSTFGGGPFVSAVALACARTILEPEFLSTVRERGNALATRLRSLLARPDVVDVRGRGLMHGVELDRPVAPVLERAFDAGLLLLQAGSHVLRFLPPLVMSAEDLDRGLDIVESIL